VCTPLNGWQEASSLVWKNRGLDEMTIDDSQADRGKTLFATSVLFFSQGLYWFGFDSPGSVFTLRRLNTFDALFRAEIVIGAIVAACGTLVWRSASRKLSLANYIIVLSCAAVLLACVSKQSEWVYFLDHQRGFSILNDLGILVTDITISACILVLGSWWADSTYMHERFRDYMRSRRFVK
jgi:hypothetical protein